jgi:hypothetical protein
MKIKFTRTFSTEFDSDLLRDWFDYAEDESPLTDSDEEISKLLATLSDWEIIEMLSPIEKMNTFWQSKAERI